MNSFFDICMCPTVRPPNTCDTPLMNSLCVCVYMHVFKILSNLNRKMGSVKPLTSKSYKKIGFWT